jgi:hypothetical protein
VRKQPFYKLLEVGQVFEREGSINEIVMKEENDNGLIIASTGISDIVDTPIYTDKNNDGVVDQVESLPEKQKKNIFTKLKWWGKNG